ncbi:hypothetical protein Rhal01_02401 [Rubritalea halochordaticola]|uniref:Lipoprotein n=2 Tax=Rubritalea halochordaticola TaxID=714537 RepID=A0ABP9V3P4_9BACT
MRKGCYQGSMKFLGLLSCVFALVLSSCSQNAGIENDGLRRTDVVDFVGTSIRSAVEPQKGKGSVAIDRMIYYAGTADLDGPFKWQIEAIGEQGKQVSMQVHEVQIKATRTKRLESYPKEMLGGPIAFEPVKDKKSNKTTAVFRLPGLLQVYPKADGLVSVIALIEIKGEEKSDKEWIKFSMLPHEDKNQEFKFLPTVIEYGGAPVPVRPHQSPEGIYVPEPQPIPQFPLPVQ